MSEKEEMKYLSTRSSDMMNKKEKSFKEVIFRSLSDEKGLYVPQRIPFFNLTEINQVSFFF